MEIIGYIIGGLHVSLGIIITVVRNLDDVLLSAKDKIQLELLSSYKEVSNILSSGTIVEGSTGIVGMLDNASNRLMRIHYASSVDVLKIKLIEWFCDKTLRMIFISIILVISSVLFGRFYINETNNLFRLCFVLLIPSFLFFSELIILYFLLKFERYLKHTNSRYTNREY